MKAKGWYWDFLLLSGRRCLSPSPWDVLLLSLAFKHWLNLSKLGTQLRFGFCNATPDLSCGRHLLKLCFTFCDPTPGPPGTQQVFNNYLLTLYSIFVNLGWWIFYQTRLWRRMRKLPCLKLAGPLQRLLLRGPTDQPQKNIVSLKTQTRPTV